LSPLRLPISSPGQGGESNIMTQGGLWDGSAGVSGVGR